MNLIALSIRRPVFAWILMSALIIFGAATLLRLGVSQMPDVDFPIVNVSVDFEGASPEVVETEILSPMEEALLNIEGIREMRSNARQGGGSVRLEFDIERNVDVALQEVQTAVNQVRLPQAVDAPIIRKQNPEEAPIMFMGVYGDRPLRETLVWIDGFLLDQFRFIEGIGEVSIGGFSARNLRIWPDPVRMKRADISILDIVDTLNSQHIESSAGQFVEDKRELRVRWLGEAADVNEVSKLRILRRGGQVINGSPFTIADVAEVEDGLSDIRRLGRIKDQPAVFISVRKMRGSNEVALASRVKEKIEELKPSMPKDLQLQLNVDFTRPTEAVVNTTYEKLWFAAIVTILVCFLFLGNWQAALNILFSIPTSIVGTFIIIYFAGFTLNLFTLLALTLAVSIVVDDAIMLLENIVRHFKMGKSAPQAAYDGAMEILPAATAATLAVIAVFIPVIFMEGVTGRFFFQFGVTMSAAVLLSLVEAVTITPMRAAALMSVQTKESAFEKRLERMFLSAGEWYRALLLRTLPWSKTVLAVSIVLFLGSLILIKKVKREFVPQQDQDIILIAAQTPPGSSLEFTDAKARELEAIVKQDPDIRSFITTIGAGGLNLEVNQITMPTYLKPREERQLGHIQVMARLREKFKTVPKVRVSMRDLSARNLTSGSLFPVSFNLVGPDLLVLKEGAEKIMRQLEEKKIAVDLDTNFKMGLPELIIKPNRAEMAKRGVSIETVARTLSSGLAGVRQAAFTTGGRRYDVRVKLRADQLMSRESVGQIQVRNNYGYLVPLKDLVTIEERATYQSIQRINRQRAVGVNGNLAPGQSQGQVLARAQEIARETLPEGYGFLLEGSAAGLEESFRSLTIALLLGILVAYMILAVQFNSFIHPVTILIALPFSVTGALLTLWALGVSLNLFSFIGLIVLMGIAKKNSILLVEFTNHIRDAGKSDVRQSLLEACPIRLRPILMTSVATVFAAFPLILGDSIGQEIRTPMGLTIIGGTILSTLFTLVVVPSLYLILSRLERREKPMIVVTGE